MRRLSDLLVGKRDEGGSFLRFLSGVEDVVGEVVVDLSMDLVGCEVRCVGCVGAIMLVDMMSALLEEGSCLYVRGAPQDCGVGKGR